MMINLLFLKVEENNKDHLDKNMDQLGIINMDYVDLNILV